MEDKFFNIGVIDSKEWVMDDTMKCWGGFGDGGKELEGSGV